MWGSKTPTGQTKQTRCAGWAISIEREWSSGVICAAWRICPSLSLCCSCRDRCCMVTPTTTIKVGRGWKKNVGGSRGDTWWQSKGGLQTLNEWQYVPSVMYESKSIISPAHFLLPPSLLHISVWFCYTGESQLANHSQKYLVVMTRGQNSQRYCFPSI